MIMATNSKSIYGEAYFGFVYIWRDRKHKRYYIGSHMGAIDDGYICSSQWMLRAYKKRPQDFKRRIIYLHLINERKILLQEEQRWLQKVLLKKSKAKTRYYNKKFHAYGREAEEISKSLKKRWTSERKEAWVKKMQEWRERDPEWKKKVSSFEGKSHSSETKAKIKAGNVGKVMSDEARIKMSEKAQARGEQTAENNRRLHKEKKIGMHGKTHSDQTKAQMSENSRWHH